MIYTDMTKFAMKIAYEAHEYQLDKAGIPYIFHPIHVAEQCYTAEAVCVALLHDVFEDNKNFINTICETFDSNIVDCLKLLQHKKDTSYREYIKTIKESENNVAIKVKIEDLKHNMDLSRLWNVTDKDIERVEKYKQALDILMS